MREHVSSILIVLYAHVSSTKYIVSVDSTKKNIVVWFTVHAFINLIVVLFTTPSLFATLINPTKSLNVEYHENTIASSRFPMCLVIWLHLYHIFLHSLSHEDVFHHFVFISLLAFPGYYYDWGVLGNFQLFFISGLPGGLIYALLAFQKCGYFLHVHEPTFSAKMNVFIRMPGVLIANICLFYCMIHEFYSAPLWALVIQLIFSPFNAIYYAHQSMTRMNI